MLDAQLLMEIDNVTFRLAMRRSVFCSEADFHHKLAYQTRRDDHELDVRPEYSDRSGRAIVARREALQIP